MSIADIKVIKSPGPTRTVRVDDRTTSGASATIKPGEPIKKSTNFAILLADGDPEVGTDEFLGIAKKESTETSAADGVVEYYSMIPGLTELQGKVTTP